MCTAHCRLRLPAKRGGNVRKKTVCKLLTDAELANKPLSWVFQTSDCRSGKIWRVSSSEESTANCPYDIELKFRARVRERERERER